MATKNKTSHKKAVAKKKPARTKQTSRNLLNAPKQVRRPAPGEPVNINYATQMLAAISNALTFLEDFATHLRPTDRQRHNGVGVKRLGFIEAAYTSAVEYPEFLPYWVTIPRFKDDIDILKILNQMFEASDKINEIVKNIRVIAGDMAFTNALEYYKIVQEAARRRVDAAESTYNILRPFFRRKGNGSEEIITEKQFMRDAKAVYKGKKDGKILIENLSPKTFGGKKKAIDRTFKKKGEYKEDIEGELE